MKKLYFLNEEEKERILKLHESATKKQYLFEDMDGGECNECGKSNMYEYSDLDEADAGDTLGKAATGAALGAQLGSVVPGLGTAIGAVAGGVIGAAYGLIKGAGGSYAGVQKIFQACNAKGLGSTTMNGGTLDSISKQVHDAIEGWGTDEDAIKDALSQVKTIPDLCAVEKRYAENYPGYTLLDDLDGDIDSDSEWNEYVYQPLLAAKRKSEELGQKSGGLSGAVSAGVSSVQQAINKVTSDKLWYNYPCIPTNPNAKPGQMSNGSTVFTIAGEVYYNNGRKKKADGTMTNYTCKGTTSTTTPTPIIAKPTVKSTGTGTNAVTQSNIKQVQKLVGVAETGVFDTATAKAVRTKLGA